MAFFGWLIRTQFCDVVEAYCMAPGYNKFSPDLCFGHTEKRCCRAELSVLCQVVGVFSSSPTHKYFACKSTFVAWTRCKIFSRVTMVIWILKILWLGTTVKDFVEPLYDSWTGIRSFYHFQIYGDGCMLIFETHDQLDLVLKTIMLPKFYGWEGNKTVRNSASLEFSISPFWPTDASKMPDEVRPQCLTAYQRKYLKYQIQEHIQENLQAAFEWLCIAE